LFSCRSIQIIPITIENQNTNRSPTLMDS